MMAASLLGLLATSALLATADGATGCEAECTVAGHCCDGLTPDGQITSACQKPSCAMGCAAAAQSASEAACNATCVKAGGDKPGAGGCTYKVPSTNLTFQMCGSCRALPAPAWWPAAAKPASGQHPGFWPPGYSLGDCSSCGAVDGDQVGECKLGCMFHFRKSLKPTPPAPAQPPAPRPPPPACGPFPSAQKGDLNPWSGCTVGSSLNFSNVFSDGVVLQMQPATPAVYGPVGSGGTAGTKVTVTVTPAAEGEASYSVEAAVDASEGTWKAALKSHAPGGSYTITAKCESGCTGSVELKDATFGDVWYCFGQSNMALPFQYSYARNSTLTAIKAGKAGPIRITGLKGNMNTDQPWISIEDAAGGTDNSTMPNYGDIPLDHFSSTCLYFGESLSEGLAGGDDDAGKAATPIGLIHTAWGGSMIEQWLTDEEIASCKGAAIADHNENLYDANVKPYAGMSVKGWVYYQGENNCGGLHGNSGTSSQPASGYGCMMPKLVELFRKTWTAGTGSAADALAFGIVSLSSHDSEGAQDMASFRWAQQGSYGTVPNKIMPNTFMAHAFDLQDPWNGNTGACLENTGPIPGGDAAGYNCNTPFFMGPSIHPRLKKPVGQRLALGALETAYGKGKGAFGGVIQGCEAASGSLTLKFDMKGRKLLVGAYNKSNPVRSATAVQVGTEWVPVHVALGSAPGTISVDLSALANSGAAAPTAVRYAWGATDKNANGGASPNGEDVSCCEGDGIAEPCVPTQCPLLAAEPLAPFGALSIDPFIAEIKAGKCVCPEPQECSA